MTAEPIREATDADGYAKCNECVRCYLAKQQCECECHAPADDVREALVSELRLWAALIGTEPRGARDLFTRAADALAEVRPRGKVTDAEVETAHNVIELAVGRFGAQVTRAALEAAWEVRP